MKAYDVMTRGVASVGPNMSTREVARILRTNGISGVPVVDDTGAPIGMISEADLIGSGDGEHRRPTRPLANAVGRRRAVERGVSRQSAYT